MSLVFSSVDVAAGPTVGLKEPVNLPVFPQGEKKENNFSFGRPEEEKDDVSSESSSLGVESSSVSSDEDDRGSDGQDEAESKLKDGALGSLGSLEESLPIKRGLSNHFTGKSKSFASLSECANASARDLAKPENPFNKRRRILMACKTSWSRRASCSSLVTSLPPLLSPDLAVLEGEEQEEEEEEDERGGDSAPLAPLPHSGNFRPDRKIKKAFKSPRSFSLSDLRHV